MQKNAFEEKLYTSTEVAEILGVSLRSIYRYLEENKLQAAVKTATGRHRFTRQNINDFLHPNTNKFGNKDEISPSSEVFSSDNFAVKSNMNMSENRINVNKFYEQDEVLSKTDDIEVTPEETAKDRINNDKPQGEQPEEYQSQEEQKVKDEPIDWLARFRQAAEKYKSQEMNSNSYAVEPESSEEVVLDTDKVVKRVEEYEKVDEPVFNYYRSGLGGLKEIAQSLDKSAKNASLDYAFTMNAGLSLHKPIKPFSLIHAYVKPQDLAYFEKVLQLTPSQKDNAQLCLIALGDQKIYDQGKELHGLRVVSDDQIKADLISEGEVELANELD